MSEESPPAVPDERREAWGEKYIPRYAGVALEMDAASERLRELREIFENDGAAMPEDDFALFAQQILLLNVGGMNFRVMRSNFSILPRTRLSRLARAYTKEQILSLCDGYTEGEVKEFYFNRNWTTFNSILDFYRKGTLHMSTETCALVFKVIPTVAVVMYFPLTYSF